VSLTKRELEVLHWIVHGKTTREIAEILGIAVNTVEVHRANILKEVGVRKSVDLVLYAIRNSLVSIALAEESEESTDMATDWLQ
jgi:DNA-binding CsgD family transcriptional regulator